MLKRLFLTDLQKDEFDRFKYLTSKDSQTSLKEKHVGYNQAPFISNNLQGIVTHSRLLNKFRKHKTNEPQCPYKKQRNYCVKLLKKTKIISAIK